MKAGLGMKAMLLMSAAFGFGIAAEPMPNMNPLGASQFGAHADPFVDERRRRVEKLRTSFDQTYSAPCERPKRRPKAERMARRRRRWMKVRAARRA